MIKCIMLVKLLLVLYVTLCYSLSTFSLRIIVHLLLKYFSCNVCNYEAIILAIGLLKVHPWRTGRLKTILILYDKCSIFVIIFARLQLVKWLVRQYTVCCIILHLYGSYCSTLIGCCLLLKTYRIMCVFSNSCLFSLPGDRSLTGAARHSFRTITKFLPCFYLFSCFSYRCCIFLLCSRSSKYIILYLLIYTHVFYSHTVTLYWTLNKFVLWND